MTVFRSTTLLIGLCITLSACSDGTGPGTDSRTILLTNALGFDYTAVAFDGTSLTEPDTALSVPNGTQVCLRLSVARLTPISMKLESFDNAGGLLLGTVVVYPTFGSWTWDGVARNATRAQAC